MEEIKEAEVQKYLTNYLPQYQLIKNARYEQGCLKAELIPFIYPFTNDDSDYVNATQLHLYLSQLTYVLVAKCIVDPNFTMFSKLVKIETYMEKMVERRLFFASIEQKMKRVIYKKNLPINAEMKINGVRLVKGTGFCEVEFNLGNKACFGTILLSMPFSNLTQKK